MANDRFRGGFAKSCQSANGQRPRCKFDEASLADGKSGGAKIKRQWLENGLKEW